MLLLDTEIISENIEHKIEGETNSKVYKAKFVAL